jgi:hypothetical protein
MNCWNVKMQYGHSENRITLIGGDARFVKRLTVNVTVTSRAISRWLTPPQPLDAIYRVSVLHEYLRAFAKK